MKKTETNITSVRGVVDTSKSIVKIKRHSILSQPSNVTRVTFNIPNGTGSKKFLALPSNIPDDQLEEIENYPVPKPSDKAPKKIRPKKKMSPPKRLGKTKPQVAFDSNDPDAKDMFRIVREFMAVEDRLDELQSTLTTNFNERIPNLEEIITNSVSLPPDEKTPQAPCKKKDNILFSPPYNAADYIHDGSLQSENISHLVHAPGNSRVLMPPLSENISNMSAPINVDIKSVISAIRKDLDEWRQANMLINQYSPNPSNSVKKTSFYSAELSTPKSEVSRDIPEKDISSSSDSRLVIALS